MKSLLGIDIGTHSIKVIEMGIDAGVPVLLAAGSMPTPPKSLSSTLDIDRQAISGVLRELVRQVGAKTTDVVLGLPESQVFTRVIEMPSLSERELASAIKWESEQYIPLPLDQVNIDFTVLRDSKETGTGKMDILLVAAPKALTDRYLKIVEDAQLTPIAAETEIVALTRAIVRTVPSVPNIMIMSLGGQTTDVAIVRKSVILFARSIPAGGDAITRAISEGLEFSVVQADGYKKAYGLDPSVLEGKIAKLIRPVMDTITTELSRAVGFFEEKCKGEHLGIAILAGGNAKLPGLVSYLAEKLGFEVQLANPWLGVRRDPRFSVLGSEGPIFSVAVGLSLRK
jgi:type IV pilus assembly protein PilM